MKSDNKKRVFEMMSRLDKTFKPIINEDFNNQNIENHIERDYTNSENIGKIPTNNLPIKLYVSNHLGNTANLLSQNIAYIHWFNSETDNSIQAYSTPNSNEAMVYEFDVAKMIKLGFKVENEKHQDMRNVWNITIPKNYAHDKTIRHIDEYMSKVIINLEDYSLIYDITDKFSFVQKFGMPTIPMVFKDNNKNINILNLQKPSLNEKK